MRPKFPTKKVTHCNRVFQEKPEGGVTYDNEEKQNQARLIAADPLVCRISQAGDAGVILAETQRKRLRAALWSAATPLPLLEREGRALTVSAHSGAVTPQIIFTASATGGAPGLR